MAAMSQEKARALIAEAAEKGWKKLNLAGLGLTELPDELWELTQLKVLILGWYIPKHGNYVGNNLTKLSPEIGQLKNLGALYIRAVAK
ncbi:MAG: leucine-rich repeat domain-containing protein [Leptolyngbya sp. SIO3F4]|nr:leucine-rich repeat domain-containing protein [Leptolyngbya sp. SIO3F4]